MKILGKLTIVLMLMTAIFSACVEGDYEPFDPAEQFKKDKAIIAENIAENNIVAEEVYYNDQSTGVYMETQEIADPTDELKPSSTDTILIHYKGYLTDGTVFDSSRVDPVKFKLNTLIAGWRIGIPEMSKGDSATFFIPSYYGYGNNEIGNIPANSVLIFDIKLLDFWYEIEEEEPVEEVTE